MSSKAKGTTSSQSKPPIFPHWDRQHRTLWFGDQIVKRFRVPAANQECILDAFEEEGWPDRIDDPLPPTQEVDGKTKLHSAIIRLNRCQVRRLLRFSGDGTGSGIYWQAVGAPPRR